jgi:hypothetical protein
VTGIRRDRSSESAKKNYGEFVSFEKFQNFLPAIRRGFPGFMPWSPPPVALCVLNLQLTIFDRVHVQSAQTLEENGLRELLRGVGSKR